MINKTIIALSLTLALAACAEKASEATAEAAIEASSGGEANVDIDGDTTKVTVQTEDGAATMSAGENVALPADFPSDMVLADERKVLSVFTAEGAIAMSYTTKATLADLVTRQDAAMKAQGWTQTMSMNTDAKSSMLAFNKDGRDAMLAYAADETGGVTVSVQLSAKK